jgi:hypothetical protein
MTSDAPTGRRSRRIDVRLVIGVLLVAASVAGVVLVVSAADRRVTVYAAGEALSPGDALAEAALVERSVALDGADGLYLAAGDLPGDGLVVTAPIRAGELVAASAVGDAATLASTAIVLQLAAPVSESVGAGSRVDIWTATPTERGVATEQAVAVPPSVLVSDAIVVRTVDSDGLVQGDEGLGLEVRVPRDRVARVLQAVADDAALAAVPAGVPLPSDTDETPTPAPSDAAAEPPVEEAP